MSDMRSIRFFPKGGAKTLHVETPLGIVNIRVGLADSRGRRVEAVTMTPNAYAGEKRVRKVGQRFVENLRLTPRRRG